MLAQRIQSVDRPIITNGLVGWWLCAADFADYSGNGNNGIAYGSPSLVDGTLYPSRLFAGLQYVACGSAGILQPTSALSFALEINASSFLPDYNSIAGMSNYGTAFGYMFDVDGTNNKLSFQIGNGSWARVQASLGGSTYNIPHRLCGVWDGSQVMLYADGVEVGAPVAKSSVAYTGTTLDIGRYGNNSTNALSTATLSDIRLYNRALSPAEALAYTKRMG